MTASANSSDSPKISCVMPTYGRPEYMNEAVWMFLQQDDPNKELIILNDCPGQTFEFDHPEVRVFNETERFANLGAKRNWCIELAEGGLIAVWDDDDVFLPWRLSFCRRELTERHVSFYRAAEFLAYWGQNWLHDNQAVPAWGSHPNTLFTKNLWRDVGGYPPADVGEDAAFFKRIHERLGAEHIVFPIDRDDRFMILRGTSQYAHMSMGGGERPLDTRPGRFRIDPKPIADPLLASHYQDRVSRRSSPVETGDHALVARSEETGERPVLSILVSLKNRSRILDDGEELTLFPNCMRSIAEAAAALEATDGIGPIELIVADFHSNDWPACKWLPAAAGELAWKLVRIEGPFSKGRGLNRAARYASNERLLLCDADLLLTPEILRRAIEIVDGGGAWSPIFQYLTRQGEPSSWEDLGFGPMAVSRSRFDEVGGLPEFESWGGEDNIFYERLEQVVTIRRERMPGLRHQWHPDRLRHAYYRRPPKSDYWDYSRVRRGRESKGPTRDRDHDGTSYYGVHPDWAGELVLFDDGRFVRPGAGHAGGYTLASQQELILAWDDWPEERLEWHADHALFQSADTRFTVRRQVHNDCRRW
ncbi:glycosyltransferase family 2 protein [Alienimonas chondri]|uniref:Glycosyltransferase n=1 Tax=Alienimonas chondri TaxID=2681879 RepID=A0ABX1VG15_9PLAN|nr:glycosyltransferase family 2 protein [Alienimonas chondri]NNJ26207.1 hypothetical protein [Alienimonas chondri]